MEQGIGSTREAWPMRPWMLAGVGCASGFLLHFLTHGITYRPSPEPSILWRQAAATFVVVSALSLIVTVERRRIEWAFAFSAIWGAILALVGFFTASYARNGELGGFPFLSGILAVGIAAPLFQVARDEGSWNLPYRAIHRYAWTDAIIGGAGLAFTGLTFLVAFLLSQLFDAIGISLLKTLLGKGWFALGIAGATFGAASGVLRERDPFLDTLQKLVMVVFSVLAPAFSAALAVFLIAVPATGFAGLWLSGLPETPLLLSAAAFAVVFLNAIIGESSADRGKGRLWRLTEAILLFTVLPLGALALVSMSLRVAQYSWTPERLWGVIACLVAVAYGIAAWLAAARGRGRFDEPLRESQKHLAIGLCGLALFLALPIVDFGAISSRSQVALLQSGKVQPEKFDYAAMAFDFGPEGRRALRRLEKTGTADVRRMATAALRSTSRWQGERATRIAGQAANLEQRLRLVPGDIELTDALRQTIAGRGSCDERMRCALIRIDDHRMLLLTVGDDRQPVGSQVIDLARLDGEDGSPVVPPASATPSAPTIDDLMTAPVEIRKVERRQVYVDGKPVGEPFE